MRLNLCNRATPVKTNSKSAHIIASDSARTTDSLDYSEFLSLCRCFTIYDVYTSWSEQSYKSHYDYIVGSATLGISIPDGSFITSEYYILLSVFRGIDPIKQIPRKILKLIEVLKLERNEFYSLYFKNKKTLPKDVVLQFDIYRPPTITQTSLKKIIKHIYKTIKTDIPSNVKYIFNIIDTEGTAFHDKVWKIEKYDAYIYGKRLMKRPNKWNYLTDLKGIMYTI